MEHIRLTPNYYFASTETGVAQMAKGAELGIWFDTDIKRCLKAMLDLGHGSGPMNHGALILK